MRERHYASVRSSGQRVSAAEALRAVTALRLQQLALLPDLIAQADGIQVAALSTRVDLSATRSDLEIEIWQHQLQEQHQRSSRLARQLREQLILIDELLASRAMLDANTLEQFEQALAAIGAPVTTRAAMASGEIGFEPDAIYHGLHDLNDQVQHRLSKLQEHMTELGQRQLAAAQIRLRRLFYQNATA
jgi:hypothetical protein